MKSLAALIFIGFSWLLSEISDLLTPLPTAYSIIAYEENRLYACEAVVKETNESLDMAQCDLNQLEVELKRMERAARKQ